MRNPSEITPIYRIGEIDIDSRAGYLRRPDSPDVYLRQQTFQVLLYLIAHRDRMVGKEELRQAIWGDVAVTDDALVQCIVDIRRALGDDARAQKVVKTIPKVGYRFTAAVEVVSSQVVPSEEASSQLVASEERLPVEPTPVAPGRSRSMLLRVGVAVAGTAALAALLLFLSRGRFTNSSVETTLATGPGITPVAVLYFENQSGSHDFAWMRQGLADMVITDLSRFDRLAVLSRQQLGVLLSRRGVGPDDPIDLDQALALGRAAGARTVVIGSFVVIGERMRFEAKLHDAGTGRLIGAEAAVADKPDQILTQVDLLALRVAGLLGVPNVASTDRGGLSAVMTSSLEAYRQYELGLQKSNALESADAVKLFQQAVQLDPAFAMAYARIGYTYTVSQSLTERAKPYLQKAFELSGRLTDKDRAYIAAWYAIANSDYDQATERLKEIIAHYPMEVEAYGRLGAILQSTSRSNEARDVLQRGLTVDPENKEIINTLGTLYQVSGQHADAIAMHSRYVALAPTEPNALDSLALSYQYAGRYDEAIDTYRRASALDPGFEIAVVHLGNTYFQLGRYREAIEQFQTYLRAADFDQDRGRGYSSMAWVEWRRGRLAAARKYADQGFRISGLVLWEQVLINLGEGRVAEAEQAQRRLVLVPSRGRPTSRRLDEFLAGEVSLGSNRPAEAIDHFRRALTHPPLPYFIEALDDCLASGLLRTGRLDEAVTEYHRVLGINANAARARFGLAQALDRLGRGPDARSEYERCVGLWKSADPDLPELIEAKRRLAALR